jgi:hypothetical protein
MEDLIKEEADLWTNCEFILMEIERSFRNN